MIATSSLLTASASVEIGAGFALMSSPRTAVRLLLGLEPRGSSVVATRAVGLGLLSLGLACLPRGRARHRRASVPAIRALLGAGHLVTGTRL